MLARTRIANRLKIGSATRHPIKKKYQTRNFSFVVWGTEISISNSVFLPTLGIIFVGLSTMLYRSRKEKRELEQELQNIKDNLIYMKSLKKPERCDE